MRCFWTSLLAYLKIPSQKLTLEQGLRLKKLIAALPLIILSTSACAALWTHEQFILGPIEQYTSKAREEVLAPIEAKKNFSGLTFVPATKSYYAIINKGDRLFEFDANFKLKRTIEISGFDDPEDLAFVKMTDAGPVLAISNETGAIYLGVVGAGTSLRASSMKRINMVDEAGRTLEFYDNKGIEGIVYIAAEEKFIVLKEKNPIKVWSFQMPAEGISQVKVKNALPAETDSTMKDLVDDLSAVSYNAKTDSIVLLSDESSKILYIDNKTKNLTKVIDIKTQLQHEALSFSEDFETTYVGSEPYYLLRINKANTTLTNK